MSTSKEYTISRKVSDTEEEIIQIPYDALADKPDLSVYQTKNDASLKTNDKTVVGAINEVATGVAETLESFGMSLAPQENGKLNKKVYVYPDGYLSQGTSYDASKDLYLSIGDGLTLETIDDTNNIWNIKSASAITSVDGLGGGAISGDVSTSGNLTVGCNLTVNGTTTTVDSTTLQVKDKLIEVAHGNTTALTTPAGLVAPKYDGTNSGALVFDSTGTAYVGDVTLKDGNIDVANSGLQPLATRTGLVGGNLVQYDSSALTLKDSGKKISDFATSVKVNGNTIAPSGGVVDIGTVLTDASKFATSAQGTKADNAMPKSGGTFTGEVKFGSTENFQGYYIKRMIGSLGVGTRYADLDSSYKDGTWHRMWRLRFPSDSNFWGKIKITLYGGYSSFNASGVMSKSITCNFNTSSIYNNVGCYDGLGVNVEQDFRISEAIWNDTANAWEVLIWQKNLNGNNSPTIMLECWTTNTTNYINAFNGITAQTVELTQSTSYSAQKASSTGGTKTVEWETLPVYENPLGEEIATVAMLKDKQDKITSSNKLSSSLVDGLGAAAAKAVDTAITANSTSTNLPTSKAVEDRINAHSGIDKVGTITGINMNGASKGTSGVVDLGTVITAHQDISGKANLSGGNTFSGLQTINAPTDVSGSEQTTMKVKTSNGGAIIFGKEGPNSGTMIRLDQVDGTCRLRFRSSKTAGAMVWEQPEQGAKLHVDLGKDGSDKHRVTFPSSAGTLALTSQIKNGTLTIQKNGTDVATFTANQSTNATANITVPTKVSELTNDSGYTTNTGTVTSVAVKMNNVTKGTVTSSGTIDLGTVITSHQDISGKLDKTTYEVNKTIEFGRDGALYVGKFKVYDTNVTCEVTSTTDVTYSGKLVIATQNYVIRQMTVYGDAANTVAPNFFIKPSTTSDPYIEVYFKPASWSKNVVHIYGSKIEAEPTDVCTNVPSVPATATLKPKNALPIFELSGTTLTITL